MRVGSLGCIFCYSARSLAPQGARTQPSGAAFLLLVRGLLDPCPKGAKVLHSNKSSAAFSRFLAGVAYSVPCSLLTHPSNRPSLTSNVCVFCILVLPSAPMADTPHHPTFHPWPLQ